MDMRTSMGARKQSRTSSMSIPTSRLPNIPICVLTRIRSRSTTSKLQLQRQLQQHQKETSHTSSISVTVPHPKAGPPNPTGSPSTTCGRLTSNPASAPLARTSASPTTLPKKRKQSAKRSSLSQKPAEWMHVLLWRCWCNNPEAAFVSTRRTMASGTRVSSNHTMARVPVLTLNPALNLRSNRW